MEVAEKTENKRRSYYKTSELDEVDRELLRLKLERPGITYMEMSEATGLKFGMLAARTLAPQFQQELTELQGEAIDIILKAKQKAARRLTRLIQSTDDNIALRAALAILSKELELSGTTTNNLTKIEFVFTDGTREKMLGGNGREGNGHDNGKGEIADTSYEIIPGNGK